MTEKLTLNKFEEAAELVKKVTLPTKLEYSETLSNMTGGKIYLKPENLQYTGAYKVRGAFYKIATLNEEQRSHGLIICRKPRAGRSICCEKIRMQGDHRHADRNTADQGEPHERLWCRGHTLR